MIQNQASVTVRDVLVSCHPFLQVNPSGTHPESWSVHRSPFLLSSAYIPVFLHPLDYQKLYRASQSSQWLLLKSAFPERLIHDHLNPGLIVHGLLLHLA